MLLQLINNVRQACRTTHEISVFLLQLTTDSPTRARFVYFDNTQEPRRLQCLLQTIVDQYRIYSDLLSLSFG
jgi:hypothetical protein